MRQMPRYHTLAEVANKVGYGEELGGVSGAGGIDLKAPVVRELKLQPGVVCGLDGDDVCAEVLGEQRRQHTNHMHTRQHAQGQGAGRGT